MEELAKNNSGLKILTDSGWEDFAGVLKKDIRPTVRVVTQAKTIECTADHKFFDYKHRKVTAAKLKPRDKLLSSSGVEIVVSVTATKVQRVYDILNAGKNHRFYANDLLVSNCEFIIDSETLISSTKLSELEGMPPTTKTGQIRWWGTPTKDNIYVVALDPSLGTGGDPAAIQIYEAGTTTQIGEWCHNRTTIPEQIKLLAEICKYIADITGQPNNIYYSMENNNIGEAALISLNEYGEDRIPGTMLSAPRDPGSSRRYRRGFNTTNKTKLAACSKFKHLIESGKMTIKSQLLISQLKVFIASGGSYAAALGENDDLVMAALLAIRMFQHLQEYHVDLDNHIRDHGEVVEPMPFIAII